jgi:predicted DNA-binding protein
MAVIDNVFKKYSKKGGTKRVNVSLKLKKNINDDLDYLSKYLGISKSKLIEDIIEASGINKKVTELQKVETTTTIEEENNQNSINTTNTNSSYYNS